MCFSYCKYMYMGANDPQGGAIFDPRGMIGRIYAEHQIASFLIFKLRVLWFPRRFIMFFHIISLQQIFTPPGHGLFGPQGHSWQDL